MKESKINNILSFNIVEPKDGEKSVSYSQYTMYAKCPHQWKLAYKDKIRKFDPSVHLVFGTAMHEVLQDWLHTLYTKSINEASEMNLCQMLHDKLIFQYVKMQEECGGDHFSTPSELEEFFQDGCDIIEFVTNRRSDYFSTKQLELVAIELPIYSQAVDGYSVYIKGYLDLVFQNKYTGKIEIWDIKTSTKGWNKYQKADKTKIAQLILYKIYLSKQFGYPVDGIDVKYFIVKRKLYEGMMFAQKRVQMFSPANGSVTVNELTKKFESFVKNAYNPDGSFTESGKFPAKVGKNSKNCKYCVFKDDFERCPKENRTKPPTPPKAPKAPK